MVLEDVDCHEVLRDIHAEFVDVAMLTLEIPADWIDRTQVQHLEGT